MYNIEINSNLNNKNVLYMRNKELFEKKLERLASEVKNIGFHIRRDEKDQAYELVGAVLERIADIDTLLRTESQD
jgi:hypothetical protein